MGIYKVYIGLGTNLGDRKANIEAAYTEIEARIGKITKRSSFYKTPPWGFDSTEHFVNTVALVETQLYIGDLLTELKKIEQEKGRKERKKTEGYSDRLIDLDIIDYNGISYRSERITVPHERMLQRNFVVYPLAEINPNWIHPELKKAIKNLIADVPNQPPIENLS